MPTGDRWNLAAIIAAFTCAVAISLLPLVSESSESIDPSGDVVSESTSRSLVEAEGVGIVAIALIPALVATAPMFCRAPGLRRGARLVASIVLGAIAILGAASVGLFVVPTLILMAVATSRSPRD